MDICSGPHNVSKIPGNHEAANHCHCRADNPDATGRSDDEINSGKQPNERQQFLHGHLDFLVAGVVLVALLCEPLLALGQGVAADYNGFPPVAVLLCLLRRARALADHLLDGDWFVHGCVFLLGCGGVVAGVVLHSQADIDQLLAEGRPKGAVPALLAELLSYLSTYLGRRDVGWAFALQVLEGQMLGVGEGGHR